MKVKIDDVYITLLDRDVKIAKDLVRHFLKVSNEEAKKQNNHTFKYTLPIVMHLMSNEIIKAIGPEVMGMILNAAAESDSEIKAFKFSDETTTEDN